MKCKNCGYEIVGHTSSGAVYRKGNDEVTADSCCRNPKYN